MISPIGPVNGALPVARSKIVELRGKTCPACSNPFPLLFAQDAGGSSLWSMAFMFVPILCVFYFLIILPQQQQDKKRRGMIENLKKNDKVLTTGGIYATVISVDASHDRVVLRLDDERQVKVAFTMASVAKVLETSTDKSAEILLIRAVRPRSVHSVAVGGTSPCLS